MMKEALIMARSPPQVRDRKIKPKYGAGILGLMHRPLHQDFWVPYRRRR
jgi:hypothetical protein